MTAAKSALCGAVADLKTGGELNRTDRANRADAGPIGDQLDAVKQAAPGAVLAIGTALASVGRSAVASVRRTALRTLLLGRADKSCVGT